MLSALYYPHISIQSKQLLKNSLILWDTVETIVPNEELNPIHTYNEKWYQKAAEIILKKRIPNKEEKERVNRKIREFFSKGIPKSLIGRERRYQIYPEKLLNVTWHQLENLNLTNLNQAESRYEIDARLGLFIMSILADECAGTQIEKVTDRNEAYSWLHEFESREMGADQYITGFDASEIAPNYDRLITISLKVLDVKDIPIKKLVKFREDENKSRRPSDYSSLRRKYRSHLQTYIQRIKKEAKTKKDVKEIEKQFKQDISENLQILKDELKTANIKALLSKEVLFTIIVGANYLTNPLSGITDIPQYYNSLGIAPLVKLNLDYSNKRIKAYKKSYLSWLFLANRPKHFRF